MPKVANKKLTLIQKQTLDFMATFGMDKRKMLVVDRVHEMTPQMRKMESQIEFKACFNNSFHFANAFKGSYCVGYAASVIPIEHAWIKVGDRYYDPTWEKYSSISQCYIVVAELNHKQMMDYTWKNGRVPPNLFDLHRLGFWE